MAQKQQLADQLQIVAAQPGSIIPPPFVPPSQQNEHLAKWNGTPLERRNAGCFLPEGTLFCLIGEPGLWWADVVIDQADVEYVRVGQTVRLKLDGLPQETFAGTIADISRRDLRAASRQRSPREVSKQTGRPDADGQQRPPNASYLARVALDDPAGRLSAGCRGRASIHVPWQSLGQSGWRWLQQSFHFKL